MEEDRDTPAVKLLSIVTDTKENTEVIGLMFYPSMKSPIKKELRSDFASHQMYSALKACRFERMEKCAWKDSTYTLNRDIVWAKAEYALELALNFKSNGSRRICAIFFNRHAIYDHSYYER
jgi:hypothetical protein